MLANFRQLQIDLGQQAHLVRVDPAIASPDTLISDEFRGIAPLPRRTGLLHLLPENLQVVGMELDLDGSQGIEAGQHLLHQFFHAESTGLQALMHQSRSDRDGHLDDGLLHFSPAL